MGRESGGDHMHIGNRLIDQFVKLCVPHARQSHTYMQTYRPCSGQAASYTFGSDVVPLSLNDSDLLALRKAPMA